MLFFHSNVHAQQRKADSLQKVLAGSIPDSIRYKVLMEQYSAVRFSDPLKALANARQAQELALTIHDQHKLGGAISKQGLIYGDIGNLELSLRDQLDALKIFESIHDTLQTAGMQLNVAMIFKKQNSVERSLEWLDKCLVNFKKTKSKIGEAYVYNNIAIIYREQKKFDEAFDYYSKSLKIKEDLHDTTSLGNGYLNMGQICGDRNDPDKGIEYCNKALSIYRLTNNIKGFAGAYTNLGNLLVLKNKLEEGKEMLLRGLDEAKKVHSIEDEQEAHKSLTMCYEKMGNYKEALKEQTLFRHCKDSILNESGARQMALLQQIYETDKKNNILISLKKDSEINDEQIAHDSLLITGAIAGIVLIFILLLLLFNRYRLREQTNKKLAETNSLINYRKKEITDSIAYARRIQESILPRFEKFNDIIPQSFLIHKPREIVSGDFYWIHRLDKIIYLAVADNLLHGVPGAFISMIGVNILNTAVDTEQIRDLDKLIQFMDKGIVEMITQHRDDHGQRRLDLSICKLDLNNNTLEFIGTDNPLFLVDGSGVKEFKSSLVNDRYDIQKVDLKKGDTIYMFTDGYVDQMGGGEGKKMLTRKVSEILSKNWPNSMEKQKADILSEFENWRGNFDQVDDVLVLGIRI